jgi:hypothetical protein
LLNPEFDVTELRTMVNRAVAFATGTDEMTNSFIAKAVMQVRDAVLAGDCRAVIMVLRRQVEFTTLSSSAPVDREALFGQAALVFDRLAPLKPKVEHWETPYGDGISTEGWNLVVAWATPAEASHGIYQMGFVEIAEAINSVIRERRMLIEAAAKLVLYRFHDSARYGYLAKVRSATVMCLRRDEDFNLPPGVNTEDCKPEWLNPVAAAVFAACEPFKPRLALRRGNSKNEWEPIPPDGLDIVIEW